MISLTRRDALAAFYCSLLIAAEPAWAQTPPRLFADSRLVTLDRISVEVVGRGPDLILIPGLASSRETWRRTAERLRSRYRLHLVQVAGFAGEPARANASGEVVAPTAEAIDAYIVAEKLAPATVVGHSLGGTLSLKLAQTHPEHLRRMFIVDSLPFYATTMMGPSVTVERAERMAATIRASMTGADDAAYAKILEPQLAGMAQSLADRKVIFDWGMASDRKVVAQALYDDLTLDLRPGLEVMRTPFTLLVPDYVPMGMQPGQLAGSYGRAYAKAPAITLKPIEGSLHFIMWDQPNAFNAALDAFLTD